MPIQIRIEFKGVGSKIDVPKNKPVAWKIVQMVGGSSVTRAENTTNTTNDGVLIIDGVELGDEEKLNLTYKIGNQEGRIQVAHNDATKAGQPLVIQTYLSLRLELEFVDTGNSKQPIAGSPLTWDMSKPGAMGQPPTVIQPLTNGATDPFGKFIQDIEITEFESIAFKFTIQGQAGSFPLKHNDATKNGNPYVIQKGVRLTALVGDAAVVQTASNPRRHWLTYESLFNKKEFKKPNCEFKLHLYLIPLNRVTIWLRDDLPANHLQTFMNSFFPDFETAHIKELAESFWWWKKKESEDWILTETVAEGAKLISQTVYFSPKKSVANRDQTIRYLEPYIVLPYNRFDNGESSRALATTNPDGDLLRIRDEAPYLWSAWKTASRSCVVRLPSAPVKNKGVLWKTNNAASIARNYEKWIYDGSHRWNPEALQSNPYDLSVRSDDLDFSLKTGVEFVGENFQGGVNHKDVIGDWLIGCLRSDYINLVDTVKRPPRDGIIVLTELITITEKTTRQLAGSTGTINYQEGIQVRDISALDKTKLYLAPLNIPFVSLDLKERKTEFYYLDGKTPEAERIQFREFWKTAFAGALGRAKALFLLRYGLQILNPNQQNFLIEFDANGKPTGTIAFRDLNDASIHREVVWALFDGAGLPPQESDGWKRLPELGVKPLMFEFEEGRMAKEGFGHQDFQETGTVSLDKFGKPIFGPGGTQFLWQRFSAFGNITKPAKGVGENLALLKNLLRTMADWGIAHNKSYIKCIESHLGINFKGIDWSKCPDPARLDLIKTMQGAEDEVKPLQLFKSPRTNGLEINRFTFTKLSDTQKTDLDSQIRASEFVSEFSNDDCLLIYGAGFSGSSVVKLGGTQINPTYLIGKDDLIVVCPKVTEIKTVVSKEKGIQITNPGAGGASVEYKYIVDANYINEMDWEERSAQVIHDYLKIAEGQKAIRDCRDRGWAPVRPSFSLRLLDGENKPMTWKMVQLEDGATTWNDITDENGEVQIYQSAPESCKVGVPDYSSRTTSVSLIRQHTELIIEMDQRFGVKVRYLP